MLPGFRFLFAAIVLSTSILVFGLGAAALLRTAHEEFANLPTRRAPPEPVFARFDDEPMPSLSLLRVDPPVDEKPLDDARAAAVPEIAPDILAPAEAVADEKPVQPETVATLSTEERPVAAATEATTETPAASVGSEVPVADVETVAAISDNKQASLVANDPAPAVPVADVLALEGNAAATRIATLGGPAVVIDEGTSAAPDRSVLRKRALERARERRRIALARRARLAREAALVQQQQINPMLQAPSPAPTPLLRFTR
jgi:hypothetical protein